MSRSGATYGPGLRSRSDLLVGHLAAGGSEICVRKAHFTTSRPDTEGGARRLLRVCHSRGAGWAHESSSAGAPMTLSLVEEQVVKSRDRVKAYGEVFTPRYMVDQMLDLVAEDLETGAGFVDKTFLELGRRR